MKINVLQWIWLVESISSRFLVLEVLLELETVFESDFEGAKYKILYMKF